jgi:hypothetical protein
VKLLKQLKISLNQHMSENRIVYGYKVINKK